MSEQWIVSERVVRRYTVVVAMITYLYPTSLVWDHIHGFDLAGTRSDKGEPLIHADVDHMFNEMPAD